MTMESSSCCGAAVPEHALRLALAPQEYEQLLQLRREHQQQQQQASMTTTTTIAAAADDLQREFCHILAERMTKIVLRYCPGCQSALFCGGACNNNNTMVCPQCQTKSCYACRQPIRESYFLRPSSCCCPPSAVDDARRRRDQLLEDTKTEAAVRSGTAAKVIAEELAKLGFPEIVAEPPEAPSSRSAGRQRVIFILVVVLIAMLGVAAVSVVLLGLSQHIEPPPPVPSPPVGSFGAWVNGWVGLFESLSQHMEPPSPPPVVEETWIDWLLGARDLAVANK